MEEDMKNSIKWLALVSLLLVVVMSFALVSCGGGNDDTDTNTDTSTDTDTNTDAVTYTVTFKHADGTEEVITVNEGGTVTPPTAKEVAGYTVAWENVDLTNISANMTVNAVKTIVEYKIEYDTKGGTNHISNPTVYTISNNDIPLNGSSLAGYDFVGWYSDPGYSTKVESIAAGTTGDIKLYAKYDLERFEIVYNLNDGRNNKDNPKDFNKDESFTFKDPSRAGFEFDGWYTDKTFTTPIAGISKNTQEIVTVYAKWVAIEYEVEYVIPEGFGQPNSENPTKYTVDQKIVLKAPLEIKAGYDFKGWFTDGTYTQQIEGLEGIILNQPKLYAKFEAIVYNVTYELNGGKNSDSNPATYTVENTDAIVLAEPSRLGCTFLGWYYGEEKVTDVPVSALADVTLTAKWEVHSFVIEYVLGLDDATHENVNTFKREADFTLTPAICDGYDFIGWYLDKDFVTLVTETNGLASDVTLYARWGQKLTTENIESMTPEETAWGEIEQLFDGNVNSKSGWYTSNGWATVSGKSATIVLDKEYDIISAMVYGWSNGNSNGTVTFYNEADEVVASISVPWSAWMDGSAKTVSDIKVKKIVITATAPDPRYMSFVEIELFAALDDSSAE